MQIEYVVYDLLNSPIILFILKIVAVKSEKFIINGIKFNYSSISKKLKTINLLKIAKHVGNQNIKDV